MNCNTQKGLLFIIIGSIITIICSLIISISNFVTQDTSIAIIKIFFGFVSFIGAIIILIGAILFLIGRKEFGEKHQKNVMNAVILFVIYFVVIIIFSSMIGYMTFSAVSSGTNITTYSSILSFASVCLVIVAAVLSVLIYYFALIELEDETGKIILYLSIISSIIISIITSFYLMGMLSEIFGSISTNNVNYSLFVYTQNIGKIGILGIIPSVLYLFSYYIPYRRIKDGELLPITSSVGQVSIPKRVCSNCGRTIPFDAMLCPYCGKDFSEKLKNIDTHQQPVQQQNLKKVFFCPNCGTKIENSPVFCFNCGFKLR